MFSKGPKNTSQYHWTNHAKFKMQYYGLSAQRILGVISRPKRKEEGIVEKTVAVMKPVNSKIVDGKEVWKSEVWVMFQRQKAKYKIISAWRYPGVSPKRNPIPDEIMKEIENII